MSITSYLGKPRHGDTPLPRLDEKEASAAALQAEREAAFVALVNAKGGMPRTAFVNGVPMHVNADGSLWREKRLDEGRV